MEHTTAPRRCCTFVREASTLSADEGQQLFPTHEKAKVAHLSELTPHSPAMFPNLLVPKKSWPHILTRFFLFSAHESIPHDSTRRNMCPIEAVLIPAIRRLTSNLHEARGSTWYEAVSHPASPPVPLFLCMYFCTLPPSSPPYTYLYRQTHPSSVAPFHFRHSIMSATTKRARFALNHFRLSSC